jgi:hypothetical protein
VFHSALPINLKMGRSVQVDATIHSYAEGCVQRRVIAEVRRALEWFEHLS